MTRTWTARNVAAAIAACAALAGCGTSRSSIALDGTWPERAGEYADVTQAWTRTDDDRAGLSMVVDVAATFKSPAWRAAYVSSRGEREGLSKAARAQLVAAERAADQASYEIEVLVATYDPRANDLGKGARSIWNLTLVGDDGRTLRPIEIVRDRRPRSEIKAYFPAFGDFHEAYVARFPRTSPLLGEGTRRITLRMASAQGKVELVWQAD